MEEIALVKASAYISKIAEQFEERAEPALIVSNEHGTKVWMQQNKYNCFY
jgi:hypothetical protein